MIKIIPYSIKLDIKNTKYEMYEEGNDFEWRLDYDFTVTNMTDDHITIQYFGYFPKELSQFYLSRETLVGLIEPVQLKPGQGVHDSNPMVIANPNLPANKDVLNQFGHRAYMVFEINHEKYYINMPFNVD